MFETNSASCGGFPGISDSFGAALWGLDYALQMAYSNFSGALFHVGGQHVYYNPFTRMSCDFFVLLRRGTDVFLQPHLRTNLRSTNGLLALS